MPDPLETQTIRDELIRHGGFVRSIARDLLADDGLADDVVQETFVVALQSPPRSSAAITAWLRQVARRLALRHIRSGERRRRREEATARSVALPPVDDEFHRECVLRDLGQAVLALREPYRSTVFGRYYENKSVSDLAREAGCPVATVESRLRRALTILRERFDHDHERGAWRLALLPLVDPRDLAETLMRAGTSLPSATAATGALIMSTQTKWALTACIAAVGLVGAWGWSSEERVQRRAPADELALREAELVPVDVPLTTGIEEESKRVDGAPLAATSADSPPTAPAAGTGSVRLRVRYADGEPATGRTIELMPWEGGNAFADTQLFVTDAQGEIHGSAIAPGRVFVHIDIADTRSIVVAAGEETLEEIEIPLGVTVRGRVLAPDGQGVEGADVWVSDYGIDTEGHVVTRSGRGGAYEVPHVASGRRIAAAAEGYDPAHLRQVKAAPGDAEQIDLRLHPGGAAVRGRIVDEAGLPLASVLVRFLPKDRGESSGTDGEPDLGLPPTAGRTDARGEFELTGLPAGLGTFYARVDGHAPVRDEIELAPREVRRHDLTLQPEGVVIGSISSADGAPVEGARVMCGDYGAPDFSLVHSGRDGRYRLDGLRPGPATVDVEHDDFGRSSVELTVSGDVPVVWNPTLDRGLVLVGYVRSTGGDPLEGWYVDTFGMEPESGSRTFWGEQRRTDANGRFEVPACPSAPLRAELRPPGYSAFPFAVQSDFLASDGERLFVVDTSRLPSAFVVGAVREGGGDLARGRARVTRVSGGPHLVAEGELDAGSFRVGPVPPGEYVLAVDLEDAPPFPIERFELAPEEELDVGLLQLPEPAVLHIASSDGRAFSVLRLLPLPVAGGPKLSFREFKTPIGVDISVWAGPYALQLRGPGSAPVLRTVELQPGERREFAVEPIAGRECAVHFVFPKDAPPAAILMLAVTRGDEEVGSWFELEAARMEYRIRCRLEPGAYVMRARTRSGYELERTVTVEQGAGEQTVEMRLQPAGSR
ncbi:MAG: sigma-70 family RNA polymerase sigma factor [Planctomycetota bacterium]